MQRDGKTRPVVEKRVLLIPGLDGDPRLIAGAADRLFPGLYPLVFDHHDDPAVDGVEGLVERALAVLDHDEMGNDSPTYVCGESFGGTLALTLARRHPERVRGLILLSTFGWYPAISAYPSRLGLLAWQLLGNRFASGMLRCWRPLSVPGALGSGCPSEIVRAYVDRPPPALPGYRAKGMLSLAFDARPWLGEIACPAFILIGTRDPVVPTRAGRDLARRLPDAELHCLPGGHLVHVVRAEQAGELIARWRRKACGEAGDGPTDVPVDS